MENNLERLILEFSKDIVREKDIDKLISKIANFSKTISQSDRCTIWLADDQKLQIKGLSGDVNCYSYKMLDGFMMPTEKGLVGEAIHNKEPLIENNPYSNKLFNSSVDKHTGYLTKSIMVIPIISTDEHVIGAIQLINSKKKTGFDAEDIGIMDIAVFYASSVLESFILHKELEYSNKMLKKKVHDHSKQVSEYKFLEQKMHEEVVKNLKNSKNVVMNEMVGMLLKHWQRPISSINVALGSIVMSQEVGKLTEYELKSNVSKIKTQLEYLTKTMHDFKNFLEPSEESSFIVRDSFEHILFLVEKSYNKLGIHIKTAGELDLEVRGYQSEFEQVVLNVLNNAKEAIEHNDPLIKDIIINVFTKDKKVLIEIQDYAGGVNDEIKDKIFDSYYTTKRDRQMGMGLDICREILKGVKGRIFLENEVIGQGERSFKGAKFTIVMPV
jgi:nitrogen-specific signal transduction histidine kinase